MIKSNNRVEKVEKEIRLSTIISEHFKSWWINSEKNLYNVSKGGRNSGKSTHISFKIPYKIMRDPISALVVRKVANTLSGSVMEQLKEALCILNVDHYWRDYKNPLELKYLPTGQRIFFRGADNPAKIKSIKSFKFPITELWVEELAEFHNENEIQIITDSILRSELPHKLKYQIFFSYNPPKRKQSFVNKRYETVFLPDNTYVHHSSYLDNPFVSDDFIKEAEYYKRTNENYYLWNYMGKPTGGGIIPFSNLEFREITNDEISKFDNICQGIDWGFAVDPVHFLRGHFDSKRFILYLFDEIRGIKIPNKILAEKIVKKGYNDFIIRADSAEPKSIQDMKSYGCKCIGAKKGPGSVEHGLEWLDGLTKIIIDPKRCPFAAKEFENIDYKIDRDGNTIAQLEDKDDHCLHGDTIVNTKNGNFKIKDLVNKTGEIHCFDEQNNMKAISKFYNVRKTGKAKIYNINLSDGRKIKCSSMHPILTKNGWKFAKDLNNLDYIIDIGEHS